MVYDAKTYVTYLMQQFDMFHVLQGRKREIGRGTESNALILNQTSLIKNLIASSVIGCMQHYSCAHLPCYNVNILRGKN